MKSLQATYGTVTGDLDSAQKTPLDFDGLAGNIGECQPKELEEGLLKIPEDLVPQEEEWTPIRVKKKRSAGSPGFVYPTRSPLPQPLHQELGLEQVSSGGKSSSLTSKSNFPPKNPSFCSGVSVLNSGACPVSAAPGPSYFGCLAAEEDLSSHVVSPKPPVPPAPAKSAQVLSPSFETCVSVPCSGPKSPSSSAGHTPFPPRRPGLVSENGPSRRSPPVPWSVPLPFLAFQKPNLAPAPPPLALLPPPPYPLSVRGQRKLYLTMRVLLFDLDIWVSWDKYALVLKMPNMVRNWEWIWRGEEPIG
ncbi:hypothetical protein NE237_026731 [Protea cynaroides]|uniref:Uncharacterized protein n=1 Tax=Protea cynaroides TaxID=273540 RepID=A0A9Q0GLY2_9MAGN|nr:hypothetical protein NE237_026731 [Protea cynaroides]